MAEVLNRRVGAGRCPQGLCALAERDQGDVFLGAVGQERFDRAET